ncbi:hypothetical protein J6590_011873 [Homalodisca vitripennis]|nr:hypothetical protein J6590_011873 [Homalodisca vitripennis]
MLDEIVLDKVDCTKLLGINLDRGLTWRNHVVSVCARISAEDRWIYEAMRSTERAGPRRPGLLLAHLHSRPRTGPAAS